MSKVKIGKEEYKLDGLSSLDLKKLEAYKKEKKLDDFDYSYYVILYSVRKFNTDVNLTLDEFMEKFPVKDVDKKFAEIGDIVGLDFKMGIGGSEGGKTQ